MAAMVLVHRWVVRPPRPAVFAGLVHPDRLPHVALPAGGLPKARVPAEPRKAVAHVLARERVGVVFAHVLLLLEAGGLKVWRGACVDSSCLYVFWSRDREP